MGQNKLLLKHGVVTSGSGAERVVLDYEAGIVYQYQDPSNIIGEYRPGQGWFTPSKPYYSSGGWGSGSIGDKNGSYTVQNTRDVLRAIGAKVFVSNHNTLLSHKEIADKNREIRALNDLAKARAKKLAKVGIDAPSIETLPQLKYEVYTDSKNVKGIDPIAIARRHNTALEIFVTGKGKAVTVDSYQIDRNLVTGKSKAVTVDSYQIDRNLVTQGTSDADKTVVAFRDAQGDVFMNSAVLRISQFEVRFMGSQSLIQKAIRKIAKYSIPFNVLASADLKLSETRVLEQGPESDHTLSGGEARHFTGALLLENAGRKFLMDIDRLEIQHGIFNAFFVEVSSSVNTIAEAYDSMVPAEVKTAKAAGIDVKRQGEWFFIATDKKITVPEEHVFKGQWYLDRFESNEDKTAPTQYLMASQIAHGKGRPNTVLRAVGFGADFEGLVCGVVKHTGREHRDLDLGLKKTSLDRETGQASIEYALWRVVPNTTVSNFTITGEVD